MASAHAHAREHEEHGLRRLKIGSSRVVMFPGVRIFPEYLNRDNMHPQMRFGRAEVVESRPKGMPSKFLVLRRYEPPTKQHEELRIHRLDPVGEARMLLEIAKRTKGTPVTAAKPLGLLFGEKGSGSGPARRLNSTFVSEYVPGVQLPMMDESTVGPELEFVHNVLRSKGIDPVDMHGRNVLFAGEKFVVIDAKHARPVKPDDPMVAKLEPHRIIQVGEEAMHLPAVLRELGSRDSILRGFVASVLSERATEVREQAAAMRKHAQARKDDSYLSVANETKAIADALDAAAKKPSLEGLSELRRSIGYQWEELSRKRSGFGRDILLAARLFRMLDFYDAAKPFLAHKPGRKLVFEL